MSNATLVGTTHSEKFARFIAATGYEDLPEDALKKVRECVFDQLGVQLFASTLPHSRDIYEATKEWNAPGTSTIVGMGTSTAAVAAAYVNATFGQGCELDDNGHAGAATIPVALALGEQIGASGREVMAAIAVGYEVFFRIFKVVIPEVLERGFHQQGVIGVFAATATAGQLLRLSEEQLVHALGVAGSHVCGITEYDQSGGEVKRVHAGLAARGGVESALLARSGLTGPRAVFEGKRGIFHTYVIESNGDGLTQGLGEELCFPEESSFKIYPTVGTLHSSFDALGEIVSTHSFHADEVKEIRVGMAHYGLAHGASIVEPDDAIGAQFSLAFSLGLRLIHGRNDLDLYMDPNLWHDPQIIAVARKVRPYGDPAATGSNRGAARVAVELNDGRTLETYVQHRKGSRHNPLSREELAAKFHKLAGRVVDESRARQIEATVDRLDQLDDLRELTSLLAPNK